MRLVPKIVLTAGCFFIFLSTRAQTDSVHYQRDSVVEVEQDCTTSFFQRSEMLVDQNKTLLVFNNGKMVKMSIFMRDKNVAQAAQHALIDLDGDGKREMVISDFTGGAHCCDEFYILRNTVPDKYQQVAKFYAGNICINGNNEFLYDFYEHFGYFFTCYACMYEDTSETAPVPIHHIVLKYEKNKMVIAPVDKELKSQINDNLGKLGEQPYQALEDDIAQDNGLRKEFAINLAVYYFSFGKNMVETQKLFNKYYRFPDAKKVWAAFTKQITEMRKTNIF